jgi:hypothetical protein
MGDEVKKPKYKKVGSMLKSKEPNKDGTDRFYIKFSEDVKAGESVGCFVPMNENAPVYVIYDLLRKNP